MKGMSYTAGSLEVVAEADVEIVLPQAGLVQTVLARRAAFGIDGRVAVDAPVPFRGERSRIEDAHLVHVADFKRRCSVAVAEVEIAEPVGKIAPGLDLIRRRRGI